MMFEYNNEPYAIGDPGYDELLFNLQNHDQFITELATFVMNQHGTSEFTVEEGTSITQPDTDNYGITFEYSLGDDGSLYEVLFTKEAGGPITVFFCDYCSGICYPSYKPSTWDKSCTPCLWQTTRPD